MQEDETSYARRWAETYVAFGYNPLPSKPMETKGKVKIRPDLGAFAKLRDNGIGPSILKRWWTPCIQLCLGVDKGLVIVDLDDAKAVEVWKMMTMHREPIRTWEVAHDPAGGKHLYFEPPPYLESLPFNTCLWDSPGEKHVKIELLGDRNLIVAPPSISPRTGSRYLFSPGCGPNEVMAPAILPDWVVELARRASARPEPVSSRGSGVLPGIVDKRLEPSCHIRTGRAYYDREQVISAIPSMSGLARDWGLRLAKESPNQAGWIDCHSIFREDRDPSAMFSDRTGSYWEPSMDRLPLTLFDLMVTLGRASDFGDAVRQLGSIYLGASSRGNERKDQSPSRTQETFKGAPDAREGRQAQA